MLSLFSGRQQPALSLIPCRFSLRRVNNLFVFSESTSLIAAATPPSTAKNTFNASDSFAIPSSILNFSSLSLKAQNYLEYDLVFVDYIKGQQVSPNLVFRVLFVHCLFFFFLEKFRFFAALKSDLSYKWRCRGSASKCFYSVFFQQKHFIQNFDLAKSSMF